MNIIEILDYMARALEKRKAHHLRKITDECVKQFLVNEDRDCIRIAIISYAFSKLLEKPRYRIKLKDLYDTMICRINEAKDEYRNGRVHEFRDKLHEMETFAETIEESDRRYVKKLFDKAKLKVGSNIYASGFSLSYACSIAGIEKQEMLDYYGKTYASDRMNEKVNLQSRLKYIEELL